MDVSFHGIDTADVRRLQAGEPDVNGQIPERVISDGNGVPCRHCLQMVAKDEPYLILAYRPFSTIQPYAEQGPIFLHAESCTSYDGAANRLPLVLEASPDFIVRGYAKNERIVYGTGSVIAKEKIVERAHLLLEDDDISFVHIRSSRNNCYQARAERS